MAKAQRTYQEDVDHFTTKYGQTEFERAAKLVHDFRLVALNPNPTQPVLFNITAAKEKLTALGVTPELVEKAYEPSFRTSEVCAKLAVSVGFTSEDIVTLHDMEIFANEDHY